MIPLRFLDICGKSGSIAEKDSLFLTATGTGTSLDIDADGDWSLSAHMNHEVNGIEIPSGGLRAIVPLRTDAPYSLTPIMAQTLLPIIPVNPLAIPPDAVSTSFSQVLRVPGDALYVIEAFSSAPALSELTVVDPLSAAPSQGTASFNTSIYNLAASSLKLEGHVWKQQQLAAPIVPREGDYLTLAAYIPEGASLMGIGLVREDETDPANNLALMFPIAGTISPPDTDSVHYVGDLQNAFSGEQWYRYSFDLYTRALSGFGYTPEFTHIVYFCHNPATPGEGTIYLDDIQIENAGGRRVFLGSDELNIGVTDSRFDSCGMNFCQILGGSAQNIILDVAAAGAAVLDDLFRGPDAIVTKVTGRKAALTKLNVVEQEGMMYSVLASIDLRVIEVRWISGHDAVLTQLGDVVYPGSERLRIQVFPTGLKYTGVEVEVRTGEPYTRPWFGCYWADNGEQWAVIPYPQAFDADGDYLRYIGVDRYAVRCMYWYGIVTRAASGEEATFYNSHPPMCFVGQLNGVVADNGSPGRALITYKPSLCTHDTHQKYTLKRLDNHTTEHEWKIFWYGGGELKTTFEEPDATMKCAATMVKADGSTLFRDRKHAETYDIEAATDDGGEAGPNEFYVVKIKSMKATDPSGTAEAVEDTTDAKDNPVVDDPIKTIYVVCVPWEEGESEEPEKFVEIEVTPFPDVDPFFLPEGWNFRAVDQKKVSVEFVDELNAKVSKAVPGEVTLQVVCCDKPAHEHDFQIRVVVIDVEIDTSIADEKEEEDPYHVFLNEDFDEGRGATSAVAGHQGCKEVDHSDDGCSADNDDEIGTVAFEAFVPKDVAASVRFIKDGDGDIKLYRADKTTKLEWDTKYTIGSDINIKEELRVEGSEKGLPSLKAILTLEEKKATCGECEDLVILKVVRLDIDHVTVQTADTHEICDPRVLVGVNDDGGAVEGEDALFEIVINSPDPAIDGSMAVQIEISKATNGKESMELYEDSLKVQKACRSYTVSQLPKSLWVEGREVSAALLDAWVKVYIDPLPDGGTYAEDEIRFTVVKVEILDAPMSYFADAESHVPLVFRVLPESLNVKLGHFSDFTGTFDIGEDGSALFGSPDDKIVEGDLIGGSTSANTFTAVINEFFFDNISVMGGITEVVSYAIEIELNFPDSTGAVKCSSDFFSVERFGDKTIPVYEIGVVDSKNGSYDITSQINHKKDRERRGLYDGRHPVEGSHVIEFSFLEFEKIVDGDANYTLQIKYDTNDSFPNNGSALEFSLADERRQGYVLIYYGRKDAGGVSNLVDTKGNDVASIHMRAFEGVDNYFTYYWGQDGINWHIYSENEYGPTLLYAASLGTTALATVGAINAWNPGGWAALGMCAALGIGVGAASAIMGPPNPESGEWGSVTMYGGYVVRDKDGHETDSFMWPSQNQDKIAIRLAAKAEGKSPSCTKGLHEDWDIDLQSASQHVEVGDLFSVFASGSIEGGSPAGIYYIWPIVWDYDIQVTLEFDVSADPTFKLWE